MGQIGEPYGFPRAAILRALAQQLNERKWLLGSTLADGQPGADEITRNWIAAEIAPLQGGGGGAGAAVSSSNGQAESLEKALGILEAEGLEAAVDHLQEKAAGASGVRDRTLLRRDMGELCLAAERPDLAAPILEGVRREMHELGKWEGEAFIGRTLESLYQSYRLLSMERPSEEWDNRLRSVADELAHVDLARRIRLDAANH